MENLKPFSELAAPDVRQSSFVCLDSDLGTFRPLTSQDVYAHAQEIQLHSGVPEVIRSHFATALNLVAYSWFFYPFNVTAQFMAYVTVEFALRTRFPERPRAPFKRLVERAIREGLVKDAGFSHLIAPETEALPPELQNAFAQSPENAYVEVLIESMPYLRNELAHGTSLLHMHGAHSVQICADFINQLFERVNDEMNKGQGVGP